MRNLLATVVLLCSWAASASQLEVGDNVRIITINGEPISSHVKKITLSEGPQILGVYFESLIVLSAEDHRFYRSPLHYVRLEADNSENYTITAAAESLEQAEAFSSSPKFQLINDQGQSIDYKMWSRDQVINQLLLEQ